MKKTHLIEIINNLSLEEKVGQMSQVIPELFLGGKNTSQVTGPLNNVKIDSMKLKLAGSILGISDRQQVLELQKKNLAENKHGIPLLIMADVIHGFHTVFPIPLAIASSWNIDLAKEMAEISALEASLNGVHVTFSPMVDLVRDPRWGRVMEATGEDPYLNSEFAKAFVHGYQGESLKEFTNVAACVKHFIGYGRSEGGLDYNHVDISELHLRQFELPSFQAAIEASAKLVMTSFNTINGLPMTGNQYMLKNILRQELGFQGVIISDFSSVGEIATHGTARDDYDAAKMAINAGLDMDMMSLCYLNNLEQLIYSGEVSIERIDEAVYQILNLKDELGLFEDPYRGIDQELLPKDYQEIINHNRQRARIIAQESMVLLKNDQSVLPLRESEQITFVGPFLNSKDILGAWSLYGKEGETVSILDAITDINSRNINVLNTFDEANIETILDATDKFIVCLGLPSEHSGEAASLTNLRLPDEQVSLIKRLKQYGKPVITVIFNGRPLELREVDHHSNAILEAWYPGTEAGNAILDILFAKVNPCGKLPMSFPDSVGQLPMSYNYFSTGRPWTEAKKDEKYITKYLDSPMQPLYPFGYGLNYSDITLNNLEISKLNISRKEKTFEITGVLENNSRYDCKETIQVYSRDIVAEVIRPVRELVAFDKILVKANSNQNFCIDVDIHELGYVHGDYTYDIDPGEYQIYVGLDSNAKLLNTITLY